MKTTFALIFAACTALTASAAPTWLEADSAQAIAARTRADFPFTLAEFAAAAAEKYPQYADSARFQRAVQQRYIETMAFGDTVRVFRKGLRNLGLLDPELNGGWTSRNFDVAPHRIVSVDSAVASCAGPKHLTAGRRYTYRFSIDVPGSSELGDSIFVWMPVPFESERQSNVKIISASPANYTLSGDRSVHNTLHFRAAAPEPGQIAHFEYTASYDACGQYFDPQFIRQNLRPYDTSSELYRQYTAVDEPHMARLDSLARAIAGDASDPFTASERVYDYIESTYPWAGAREYSTIPCIPRYVLAEGHGDCGQVSLLYISLMRTLGIPARWESGWMLHPGAKNYHDWAEVYFEGVGWVPVDVSFGRYVKADDPRTRNFYSTGLDQYRFATNRGVCGEFFPPKQFVRSETVDHQAGEVECSRGNLFWPAWDQSFTIISMNPLDTNE